ncbi:MAG: hypothetical protein ABT20_07890 [Rubrivivax sp. SCN 70-15]|nr:MAG: hypothetical protein ABT20_07890 [Rubrivivax sp. SCN 70-15]
MQATNRHGMPKHILAGQGVLVTLMSSMYFGGEAVSVVFFLLSAMTVALYLIAYMLMYAAAIRLRYSMPSLARPFRVPGGLVGMWTVAGVGFIGVLFSFLVAFFPPDQLPVGSPGLYVALVVIGTVVFCGMPLFIHQRRRPGWAGTATPAGPVVGEVPAVTSARERKRSSETEGPSIVRNGRIAARITAGGRARPRRCRCSARR